MQMNLGMLPVIRVGGETFQVPMIKNVQVESDDIFGVNNLLLLPEIIC